jgi:hypothetical protein
MQLIDPEILADAQGLSPALSLAGLAIGLIVWLMGWWSHRFWIVLCTTTAAGIFGLTEAAALRTNPVVAGLLLALAAGVLALALIRLVAFVAGGVAALLILQVVAPTLDQPLIIFLTGGLLAVLLFRLWMMALTSWCGTLLVTYSTLCLLDGLHTMDAITWSEKNRVVLNWACAALAVVGLIVQFAGPRWLGWFGKSDGPKKKSDDTGSSWFAIGPIALRKAG